MADYYSQLSTKELLQIAQEYHAAEPAGESADSPIPELCKRLEETDALIKEIYNRSQKLIIEYEDKPLLTASHLN